MEATTEQQQQQCESMLNRKIKELNETLKEYIGEARNGAQMGNYESSQVFYEGLMHEIEKLISMSSKSDNVLDGQKRDVLLTSLKKLESELQVVKGLATAMEPIKTSLACASTGVVLPRPSSMNFDPIELPVCTVYSIFYLFIYQS